MQISWLGQGCFKIEVKSGNEEVTIITDPFDPEKTGLKLPRTLIADVLLQTGPEAKYLVETREGKKPFVINGPGEYEISGVFIYVIPLKRTEDSSGYLLRIEAEHLVLVHTGALNYVPVEAELEAIEGLDILCIPVGGQGVLDGKKAAELTAELEPRIVIPMLYKVPGLTSKAEGVESFLKAVGAKSVTLPKLKLTRKDLPVDDQQVVVLDKI